MKIRTGFVSNSSSASFIVNWRCNWMNKEDGDGLEWALYCLMDIWNKRYDDEENKIVWNIRDDHKDHTFWGSTAEMKKYIEEIIRNTEAIDDEGRYCTRIFTSMMNDYRDFGPAIQSFMMAMGIANAKDGNKIFEILSMDLKCD